MPANNVSEVSVGNSASFGGTHVTVASVSRIPMSFDEARDIVGSDYLASALMQGDWAYLVRFEGEGANDLPADVPLSVSITTSSIPPVSLIFGANQ